ncbi:MAG: hypothetical protein ACLR2G_06595 [Phascolarctobacterium faecium]
MSERKRRSKYLEVQAWPWPTGFMDYKRQELALRPPQGASKTEEIKPAVCLTKKNCKNRLRAAWTAVFLLPQRRNVGQSLIRLSAA